MKKIWKWLRRLVLGTALIIVAVVGWFLFTIERSNGKLEAVPRSPANFQPAALELIRLCQSDPGFYSRESVDYLSPFNPVWAPASVTRLGPESLLVEPDEARVFWGGGFYHCGWDLQRESNDRWTLYLTQDNQRTKALETITVPPSDKFTEDQYVNMVLAEIDRRLASGVRDGTGGPPTWGLSAGRDVFLAKHNRLDLLAPEVSRAAVNYPHAWRDVLLCYLIDQRTDNTLASDKLRQWAARTGGPAAWIFAAFAFYQSGYRISGDDAVKMAGATSSADPDWIVGDLPGCEVAMAVRLYQSGKMPECASLCDAIEVSQHLSTDADKAVQNLHIWALGPATSRPAELPKYDEFTVIDPFGGFDLELLKSATPAVKP